MRAAILTACRAPLAIRDVVMPACPRDGVAPLVARSVALSDARAGLAAFDGPAAPGAAVVNDLLH